MQLIPAFNDGFWLCKHTWKRSRVNTLWCLLGCSIGDFGTIFVFQNIEHSWSVWQVMTLAIINGCLLYTSPSPRDVEESRMPSSA